MSCPCNVSNFVCCRGGTGSNDSARRERDGSLGQRSNNAVESGTVSNRPLTATAGTMVAPKSSARIHRGKAKSDNHNGSGGGGDASASHTTTSCTTAFIVNVGDALTATEHAAASNANNTQHDWSAEKIRKLAMLFWESRVVTTAVEIGLFTELALAATAAFAADAHPKALPNLTETTAAVEYEHEQNDDERHSGLTHACIVRRLCLHEDLRPDFLDALVSLNLLHRRDFHSDPNNASVYTNTAVSNRYLVSFRRESYIGDVIVQCGTRLYRSWLSYPQSLVMTATATTPMGNTKTNRPTTMTVVEIMALKAATLAKFRHDAISPKALLDVAFGFCPSRVLHAAVELNLFTLLQRANPMHGRLTTLELQHELGLTCSLQRTVDFLDALVHYEMLQSELGDNGKKYYRATPDAAHYLVRRHESSVSAVSDVYYGGFVLLASRRIYPFWTDLPEALTTGMQQNDSTRLLAFQELYQDAQKLQLFLIAMRSHNADIRTALVRLDATAEVDDESDSLFSPLSSLLGGGCLDWTRFSTVTDVGGSCGELACALAHQYPHLQCTVTDLAAVQPMAQDYIAQQNFKTGPVSLLRRLDTSSSPPSLPSVPQQRVQFQALNFLKHDIPSADVIVLSIVLHDWPLATKKLLLQKAFAALPDQGGVLVVIDAMIDDNRRSNTYALCLSLHMLIEFGVHGGFDYTGADLRTWCYEAGFAKVHIQELPRTPFSMAVACKV